MTVTDPKAIDRSVNAVEAAIAKRQGTRKTVDLERLQRLYLKRERLQKKQFEALQRRLRKGAG